MSTYHGRAVVSSTLSRQRRMSELHQGFGDHRGDGPSRRDVSDGLKHPRLSEVSEWLNPQRPDVAFRQHTVQASGPEDPAVASILRRYAAAAEFGVRNQ